VKAAEMTASCRAMEARRRTELYGPTQKMQSAKYLRFILQSELRVSTFGGGGESYTESTCVHMVQDLPVVMEPNLFDLFMKGDFEDQLSIESFMKEDTYLQCDEFVSRDRFHAFLGIIFLMEGVFMTFMGVHFDRATLDYRNDVSSSAFPHRSVTSEALVLLTWEAVKDAMNTIRSKEKDERFGIVLDNLGCVELLKRHLALVVKELKDKDRRQTIHEQLAMNAEQRKPRQGRVDSSADEVKYSGIKGDVQEDEFVNGGRCGICVYDVLYKLEVKNRAGHSMFCQKKDLCDNEHRELHTITVSEVKDALCGYKDSLRDYVEKAVASKVELFRV
jgi:hypothetical protein